MNYILDQEKTWIQRDFGLDRRLIKALSKLNYTYPTLVQSKCIPLAIQGKDCCVRARTGSGKTLAFALPLLHKLLVSKSSMVSDNTSNTSMLENSVFGIILAPTKELCKQIEKNMNDLLYYCKEFVTICSLVDDNAALIQYRIQSMPDILISTPAKLVQYMNSNKINISQTKLLIIDEADLILSFGYAEDVQAITSHMPKIFQGLLMSATLSPALDKFKRIVLNNPAILKLEEPVNSGKLLQFYLQSTPSDKYLILYVFLKLGLLQGKGLIFVNDVNKCYRLKLILQQFYINSAVLNAEMPLNSRMHILDEFNRGVFDYLIATDSSVDHGNDDENDDEDESALVTEDNSIEVDKPVKKRKATPTKSTSDGYGVHRGLDFQGVSFVINFDFPVTSAAYTHRIGRTARAGASGTALSFISLPVLPGSSHIREEDNSYRDMEILQEVQSQQPRLGTVEGDNILASMNTTDSNDGSSLQPAPLVFNMKEIESFRYRVEDTVRSVTSAAVKELRAAELKRELLNSEKLKSFFAENPNDFKILRHDKAIIHPIRMKEHLKIVPQYLIPPSMQSISNENSSKSKQKKKRKSVNQSQDQSIKKSKMRDPLRNPSVISDEGSAVVTNPDNETAMIDNNDDKEEEKEHLEEKILTTKEASGISSRSMSGRKLWKLKHGKGPFNTKANRKKNVNTVPGSFVHHKKRFK